MIVDADASWSRNGLVLIFSLYRENEGTLVRLALLEPLEPPVPLGLSDLLASRATEERL